MSLKFKEVPTFNKVERIGEGLYPARVVGVVDVGIQKFTDFNQNEVVKPKLVIIFELPTETLEVEEAGEIIEKPRWVSREFIISFHEKSGLMKILNGLGWKKGENLDSLINKPCMVELGSTSTGNDKLQNVTKVPKGIAVADLYNSPLVFDMDEPDMEVYNKLPKWIKTKITEAVNYDEERFSAEIPF